MSAWCRIELLGGLRVVQDGRVITRFQTRQTAAVLAYLAFYRDRPHSRDLLMAVAWPEDAGYTDRHKLRVALNSLRRQLEPPGVPAGTVILADRQTVQLNARVVASDVADFEAALQAAREARGETQRAQHLTTAVAQYRGDLLPHAFEEWIVPERQHLQEAYLQALSQLVRHLEQGRDLSRAVDYARRAVAADPLCEESHYELIRLFAAAGQPEAARRQYRELERLLEQELGATPAAATRELLQTIEREAGSIEPGGLETRNGFEEARERTTRSGPAVQGSSVSPPMEELLPAGTLTFLLVEIEGTGASEAMREGLRPLFRGYGGRAVPGTAGLIVVAFGRASEALAAAVAGMEDALRSACCVSDGRRPAPGHGVRAGPRAVAARPGLLPSARGRDTGAGVPGGGP